MKKLKPKLLVEAGQPLKVGDLSLDIIQEIEAGDDKRVYKVEDKRTGFKYVYKYSKKRTAKKEMERVLALAQAGLPHPKVISHGPDFILRQWVEGQRGDVWLVNWESFDAPIQVDAVQDLFRLLDTSARAGLYVGKLDPEDLVFESSSKRWQIVDSGGITKHTPREAARRYFSKMFERWGVLRLNRHRVLAGGGTSLSNLLSVLSPLGSDYPEDPAVVPKAPKALSHPDSYRDHEDGDEDPAYGGTSDEDDDEDDDDDEPRRAIPQEGFAGGRREASVVGGMAEMDMRSAYPATLLAANANYGKHKTVDEIVSEVVSGVGETISGEQESTEAQGSATSTAEDQNQNRDPGAIGTPEEPGESQAQNGDPGVAGESK